jgi:hypothetical protein
MSQAKGAEIRKLPAIIQGTSVIALLLNGVAYEDDPDAEQHRLDHHEHHRGYL